MGIQVVDGGIKDDMGSGIIEKDKGIFLFHDFSHIFALGFKGFGRMSGLSHAFGMYFFGVIIRVLCFELPGKEVGYVLKDDFEMEQGSPKKGGVGIVIGDMNLFKAYFFKDDGEVFVFCIHETFLLR